MDLKNNIRKSNRKLCTLDEARAVFFCDQVDDYSFEKWLYRNEDLLTPEMISVAEKERIVDDFYKSMMQADELWKKIIRVEGYHGQSAETLEKLLQHVITEFDLIKNYTTISDFDMSVNQGRAEHKLELLYKRQKKFKPGELPDRKIKPLQPEDFTCMTPNQAVPATPEFSQSILDEFYRDYPEKPFISKDREAEHFPTLSLVPIENMTRLDNGLLPGHIWQLYWISKIHHKRIPVYFEYEYGIQFMEGMKLLREKGFLKKDWSISKKGEKALETYSSIIEEHS